jgi:hypothetical protein
MTNFLSIVLYFRIEQDVTGAVDRMVTGAPRIEQDRPLWWLSASWAWLLLIAVRLVQTFSQWAVVYE